MKYKIFTTLAFSLFLSNSYALEQGMSEDVFKKRVYKENKEEIDRKDNLIKDSQKMSLEELSKKYTPEEIIYIKRINEVYENQNLEIKQNLRSVDERKGIE